ncbi:MAG: GNAT family N-acetyltransferase [Nonlabens sp.]
MNYTVRSAQKADMPRVLELIKELAIFENEPDAVLITVEDLINGAFGREKLFKCFVCEKDDHIQAMAICYPRFSTWKGKTIHLEDLIVTQKYRGQGLGKALYSAVMKYAFELKVGRVEWVVLDWNTSAINFYESTGAVVDRQWNIAQMDQESLANYIDNL